MIARSTSRSVTRLFLVVTALVFSSCGGTTEAERPAPAPRAAPATQDQPAPAAELEPLPAPAPSVATTSRAPEPTTASEHTSTSAPQDGEPATTPPPVMNTTAPAPTAAHRFVAVLDGGVPALPGSGGARGSGCSPGAGPLPDGVWYGFFDVLDDRSIEFDLACWYFTFETDAPCTAAPPAGDSSDDYCVANENPTLRTVPVATDAVFHAGTGDPRAYVSTPFTGRPGAGQYGCPVDYCGYWLYVNGGAATEIMAQYIP